MRMRKLGALEVSELGFGILSFTSTYGQAPDKAESIRVIRGAHDLGVTLFDTAEAVELSSVFVRDRSRIPRNPA
jgi:aryl-alcohol dehydrogenase-like predicted oxidoreductase